LTIKKSRNRPIVLKRAGPARRRDRRTGVVMRGAMRQRLMAGRPFSGVTTIEKPRIQATSVRRNASLLANSGRLCYYATPCGRLGRNSYRSTLAKILLLRKITANVRKHEHGMLFAGEDAWTVKLFRNKASLPLKGVQAVPVCRRRERRAAERSIRAG